MENTGPRSKLGRILAWMYVAIIGGSGLIVAAEGDVVTGVLFFASALFVFPPLNNSLHRIGVIPPPTWIKTVCAVVLFIAAGAIIPPPVSQETAPEQPLAPPPAKATTVPATPQSTKAINKAFTECLLAKARADDSYTSFDGGKSAVMLLGDCGHSMNAYVDDCKRGGDTEGNCTLKAGMLAQAGLKLLDR